MSLSFSSSRIHYFELFAILLLFGISINGLVTGYLSSITVLALAGMALALVAYTCALAFRGFAHSGYVLHGLFALFMLVFVLYTVVPSYLFIIHVLTMYLWLYIGIVYLVIFLPVIFLVFISAYLLRNKRFRPYGIAVAVAVLAILLFYYLSGYVLHYAHYDDEVLLSFLAVKTLLHGGNPYAVNYSTEIYNNASMVGASVTTKNTVVGIMDYPSLYFLALLPFYFAGPPTSAGLLNIDLEAQSVVFIFALFMALAYVLTGKKSFGYPGFALLFFLAFFLPEIPSITTFLMLAILVLAYVFIDKEYAWLLLGVALALQEQLWLPVLFLFVYAFNTQKPKVFAKNLLGAAAVFFLINGYFIVQGPTAFFTDILAPIGYLVPNAGAPFGFSMLALYGATLGMNTALFFLSLAACVLAMLLTNKKRLIPLFSFIPLMLLQYGLDLHYAFFSFFLLFAFSMSDGNARGWLSEWLRRNRHITIGLFGTIALLGLIIVSYYHQQSIAQFNVSIVNQSITLNYSSNSTLYTGELVYNKPAVKTVYLVAVTGTANGRVGYYGFFNESIFVHNATCTTYECLLNVNAVHVNGTGEVPIRADFEWQNQSSAVNSFDVFLYNGTYYYSATALNRTARGS